MYIVPSIPLQAVKKKHGEVGTVHDDRNHKIYEICSYGWTFIIGRVPARSAFGNNADHSGTGWRHFVTTKSDFVPAPAAKKFLTETINTMIPFGYDLANGGTRTKTFSRTKRWAEKTNSTWMSSPSYVRLVRTYNLWLVWQLTNSILPRRRREKNKINNLY